jgi:hypothetical protein
MTSGPLNNSTTIGVVSYSGFASGPATLSLTNALDGQSGFTSASFDFMNKNGQAGQEGRLSFEYSQSDQASGTATGTLGEAGGGR